MGTTALITVLIVMISMMSSVTTAFVIHRQLDNHKCPPCETCNSQHPAQHRATITRKDRNRPKLSTQAAPETSSTTIEPTQESIEISSKEIPYEPSPLRSALYDPTQPRPRITVSPKVIERHPHYVPPYYRENIS